jgi:hypothetical protein
MEVGLDMVLQLLDDAREEMRRSPSAGLNRIRFQELSLNSVLLRSVSLTLEHRYPWRLSTEYITTVPHTL